MKAFPLRFGLFVVIPTMALAALAACANDRPGAGNGTTPPVVDPPGLVDCRSPNEGCACDTPGATVQCGHVNRVSGDYLTCSEGQRTCTAARTWGACIGDGLATRVIIPSLQTRGLANSPAQCADPCDFKCEAFSDTPPGLVLPADSGLEVTDAGLGLTAVYTDGGASCSGLTAMADQTMTVTKLSPFTSSPATSAFSTSLLPAGCAGTLPLWSVDRVDLGAISGGGAYSHAVPIPGVVNVTAYVGSFSTAAKVTVKVDATDVSAAPSGYTIASFPSSGFTSAEAAPSMLYPYANTILPQALAAPFAMWKRAGATAAKAVKVSLVYPTSGAPTFRWQAVISESASPGYQIPDAAWRAFSQTAAGNTGNIVIQRIDSANKPQAPIVTPVQFTTSNLRGRIYYSEYTAVPDRGDVKVVLPFGTAAPVTAQSPAAGAGNCGVCHSMSADATKFITSNQVNGTSPNNLFAISNVLATGALQPLGTGVQGGGDSRGLAYSAITRTGTFALLGNNWWGNVNAGPNATTPGSAGPKFKVFQLPTTAVAATDRSDVGFGGAGNVWGLGAAQMYAPSFSPDNTRLVFVDADTTGGAAARQGVSFWSFDEAGKRFSNRTNVVKTTSGGSPASRYVRWPVFELDSTSVLFMTAATSDDDGFNWYAGMLPSGCCGRVRVRGQLWSVNSGGPLNVPAPSTPVALTKANKGLGNPSPLGTDDTNRSYQPTMLQAVVGGYRWMVFTSNRAWGNRLNTGTGALSTMSNKLWVAAVDDLPSGATDRSHEPFLLPNQDVTTNTINERGFWSLDACKAPDLPASTCQGNDECCGYTGTGSSVSCVVDTPLTSPVTQHCKTTSFPACRSVGQSCTTTVECCGAPANVCASGTCQQPPPVLSYGGAATFTRDYVSTCGVGQVATWRFFDWKTQFPTNPGSSIVFSARTADTVGGLAAATAVPLGTQATTNNTFLGADVSAALKAAAPPQASKKFLRVSITISPSTDTLGTPVLTSWRQAFDCVDSE